MEGRGKRWRLYDNMVVLSVECQASMDMKGFKQLNRSKIRCFFAN